MKYCISCFYPDTKPDLVFDKNGKCSSCISFEQRNHIDWEKRKAEFLILVNKMKSERTIDGYDCVVPVSGGKDSTWQVLKILEYGLKPLCVNSRTCDLSVIGRENLDNIKYLGVDLIEINPNPIIRKKLNKIGLLEVGDISWPEHIGIFTIPVKIALQFKIRHIFWGENSQNEYGGPIEKINNNILDRSWLEEFGGLLGLRMSDISENYKLNANDLGIYLYPDKLELSQLKLEGKFLGYYFEWNGYKNAVIAKDYGFKYYEKNVEGTPVNYENLDNYQTGIHDYFKFIKFGFGRATDIANNLYKRRLITREEAIKMIRENDGLFPSTYLGKKIEDILKDIDVSMELFLDICDKFTNKKIFKTDNKNKPLRDVNMNLIFKNDFIYKF